MITLYEGVPGSGKSLFAAGQILDQLSLGHLVICNYPFVVPSKKKYRRGALVTCSNDELSVSFLLRWYNIWLKFRCGGEPREHQIFLVIDEAGTFFNPRDWHSSGRREWLSFFAQHRKLMFDVVLIAQQDIMVDKQIRGCIDVLERFADIRKFFPDRGWYLPPIFKRSGRVYLSKTPGLAPSERISSECAGAGPRPTTHFHFLGRVMTLRRLLLLCRSIWHRLRFRACAGGVL